MQTIREDFLSDLGRMLGGSANASMVYGPPIEKNGVTLVPVAKVRYGFGGGTGRKQNEQGVGGGGGAQVLPLGFIEVRSEGASFHRIRDTTGLALMFLAAGISLSMIFRGLRALMAGG